KVEFQNLTKVHAAWHAEWGQNNVYGATILHVRHVFLGENARDNTFVTVTAGELVTDRDRAQLRNLDMDALDDATFELMTCLARKYFDANDATTFAVFHAEARVLHIACFVAEDRTQEALFRSKLRLTFWSDFTYQNVARANLGTS